MKSKARTPAKTIKKIFRPWSVAMMKRMHGLENRGFHNETAATSKIRGE
jgi:hypothetical protein